MTCVDKLEASMGGSNKAVSAGASMASYMQRGNYANRNAIMSGNIEAGIWQEQNQICK